MDTGRFRVGLSMLGSYINASHSVDPDQHEPGVPIVEQPRGHIVDIGMLEWDLDVQLGVHRRFAFEVMLPIRTTIIRASFLGQNGDELSGFESIHHRNETIAGVGDLVLGGRIGLVLPSDIPRWTLDLRTGVAFPTGKIEPDPVELGAQGHAHQHMFIGSGTFDPIVGLETNIAFNTWALVGWTMAKLPLYDNEYGYQGSKVLVGGIGAASGFGLQRWSFLVQPEIYFETPATWSGDDARNSGRTSLLATAGVFARPAKGWQVHLLAKIPAYTWAKGGQLRWPFVAVLGFSYTFDVVRRNKPTVQSAPR